MVWPISSQNIVIQQRTPEQEALKQTEKLQSELNLSTEQAKLIYEINLHYARQRQISNTRTEAMERIKNKNVDIQRILTEQQNIRLENKRVERSSVDVQNINRTQNNIINPSSFRSSSQDRVNPSTRVISSEIDVKNNNRTTSPQTANQQPTQTTKPTPLTEKRSITTTKIPTRTNSNPQPTIRIPNSTPSSSRSQSNNSSKTTVPSNSKRR